MWLEILARGSSQYMKWEWLSDRKNPEGQRRRLLKILLFHKDITAINLGHILQEGVSFLWLDLFEPNLYPILSFVFKFAPLLAYVLVNPPLRLKGYGFHPQSQPKRLVRPDFSIG
jgi:hypothetical protein